MGRALVVLLHWYVFFLTVLYINCHVSPNVLCREKEKEALLTFKKYVKDPSNRLLSWTGKECCTWEGISCDNITGHVIKLNLTNPCKPYDPCDSFVLFLSGSINDSLKELNHLQYLDLSFNHFEHSHIPNFLGSFQKLKYLNLCQLSSYKIRVDNLKWLSNLSSLEVLGMSEIDLSKVSNSSMMISKSLVTLDLSYTSIPMEVAFHIPTLKNLDLSGNSFTAIPNWLCNTTNLERLDFSSNKVSHVLLSDINCLSHLKHLDLSMNNIEGKFPIFLSNLCNLKYLDFSSNNLEGELHEILGNSSTCNVKTLEYLDLSGNSLSGPLPNQLGKLKKLFVLCLSSNSFVGIFPMAFSNLSLLRVLDVSGNKLFGKIPTSIGNLSALRELIASGNQLNGAIPTSLGDLWNLEDLDIANNNLEGSISELHFSNLTRLKSFDAHSNQLKLIVPSNWIPPFQLQDLSISSMQVGPQFPSWIESQKDLQFLDLSSSGISEIIPSWFWSRCPQINILDLSQNQIHGTIPNLCGEEVFLSSNNFSGPLPHLSPTVQWLDLSNNSFHDSPSRSNNFSGPLPHLSPTVQWLDLSNNSFHDSPSLVLCKPNNRLWGLEHLDLSKNLLYGQLPHCMVNYSDLRVLDLGDNSLTGNISSSFSIPFQLESLSLHQNNLFGNFPQFLWNCSSLDLLDLSENNLSGNLPIWLGNSSPLLQPRFIVLCSNKFGGNIPNKLCHLHSLQILDLAQNNLIGSIPHCFGNLSGMVQEPDFIRLANSTAFERTFLITKREKYEYRKLLTEVTFMDLSSNNLTGEIPKEFTNLCWLRFLNLSNNHIHGNIPKSFNGMKQLESLDLSWNQLTGVIPQSMGDLSFLSILNLSYNDLSGRIPTSTQLQSFSKFDFIGNGDLCGPPLTTACPGDNTSLEPVPSVDDGGGENGRMDKRWYYMGVPFGFVVGFWGLLGPLAFNKAWRYGYYKFWDGVSDRLFGGI